MTHERAAFDWRWMVSPSLIDEGSAGGRVKGFARYNSTARRVKKD